MIAKAPKPLSKTALAKQEGVSRSMLYYRPRLPAKDWQLKNQIEELLKDHPSYGHKRIALELGINKKRTRRVMKLFGIKPYRRRGHKFKKTKDFTNIYPNLLQLSSLFLKKLILLGCLISPNYRFMVEQFIWPPLWIFMTARLLAGAC